MTDTGLIEITLAYDRQHYDGTLASLDEIPTLIENTEAAGEYDCVGVEIHFTYVDEEERAKRARRKEARRIAELIENAQYLVPKLYEWAKDSLAHTNQVDAIKITLDGAHTSMVQFIDEELYGYEEDN